MIEKLTKDKIDILSNDFFKKELIMNELKNNPFAQYLIYQENNDLIAYLYYSEIYDRTEINMLEVRNDKRNQKIGSKLLEKFIEITNKPSTLEVKINNYIAINLYQKYGYKKVAIRKGYYNGVDGILMERSERYEWKRNVYIRNRK